MLHICVCLLWYPSSLYLQRCPDAGDVPSLVSPTDDKLDLEHLFRDLLKYRPYLSPHGWAAWEDFKTNSADLTSTSASCPWEMPSLVSAAIRAAADTHLHRVEPVTANVTALLEKETRVPSKVYNIGLVNT